MSSQRGGHSATVSWLITGTCRLVFVSFFSRSNIKSTSTIPPPILQDSKGHVAKTVIAFFGQSQVCEQRVLCVSLILAVLKYSTNTAKSHSQSWP